MSPPPPLLDVVGLPIPRLLLLSSKLGSGGGGGGGGGGGAAEVPAEAEFDVPFVAVVVARVDSADVLAPACWYAVMASRSPEEFQVTPEG